MNIIDIFFLFFLLATAIQLFYWLGVFPKIIFHKNPPDNGVEQPVSIIICAKNEAENLRKNLPLILNQTYPCFEVIIINDNSFDKTEEVLLEFQKIYPILRTIRRQEDKIGKKFALADGIQSSKYNVLLLTDADCRPSSLEWLRIMQRSIAGKVEIGLGYSPYFKYRGLLNIFIRYETFYTALQYISFALWKKPYMGVGRNMTYKKKLYYKVGGFESHEHIASGDDDLFINSISHLDNTTIVLDKRTFVYSEPKRDWKSFFRQKTRHLSTGTSYRLKHKLLLGLFSGSHVTHYFLGTFTLFQGYTSLVVWGFLIRMSIILLVSRFILRKLDEKDLLMWTPVLDVMMLLYYIILSPALVWKTKNHW